MPDKRSHRGPHPEDAALFCESTLGMLQDAVSDMCWLLSKGYADKSSLKLVGDRYDLTARQRIAVMRSACSDQQRRLRQSKEVRAETVRGVPLLIDGYNLLITIEAALGHAVLIVGADGCIRDIASIHGTYRKVEETLPAIQTIGHILEPLEASEVVWFLDKPVSNSGRLRRLLEDYADQEDLKWRIELLQSPDKELIATGEIIASSDSAVLDGCGRWINLGRMVLETIAPEWNLNLFDLRNR